jgi:putative NADH-flavin reductase
MRILILGATGPTGLSLIGEALARQHTVVLYVRSPEKLPEDISTHPAVTVVKGSLDDLPAISTALDGVQAVVSALGPSVKKGPFHPSDTPLAHGYSHIIAAMLAHNVLRLIALGTASITDPNDKFNYQFWVLVSGVAVFARNAYKDVVAIGKTIREEGAELEWTIARVPVLTDKESKEVFAGYIGDGKTKTTLSRAAFADFVLGELEKNEWVKTAPLVCSP